MHLYKQEVLRHHPRCSRHGQLHSRRSTMYVTPVQACETFLTQTPPAAITVTRRICIDAAPRLAHSRGPEFLGAVTVLLTLSTIAVVLRFLARSIIRTSYGWDDWLMLFALVIKLLSFLARRLKLTTDRSGSMVCRLFNTLVGLLPDTCLPSSRLISVYQPLTTVPACIYSYSTWIKSSRSARYSQSSNARFCCFIVGCPLSLPQRSDIVPGLLRRDLHLPCCRPRPEVLHSLLLPPHLRRPKVCHLVLHHQRGLRRMVHCFRRLHFLNLSSSSLLLGQDDHRLQVHQSEAHRLLRYLAAGHPHQHRHPDPAYSVAVEPTDADAEKVRNHHHLPSGQLVSSHYLDFFTCNLELTLIHPILARL